MAGEGVTTLKLDETLLGNRNSVAQPVISNERPEGVTTLNIGNASIRETGAAFGAGAALSSPRAVYQGDYTSKLLKGNSNIDPFVIGESLANQQGGWSRAGNSVVQLGATILGGTISGVGSILNLPETIYNQIADIFTDNRQDNWDKIINDGLGGAFTSLGIGIEDAVREAFPIHQTARAQEGGWQGMGDATWWASRFPTVGSAISSMIPVIGGIRALGATGKLLQAANGTSRLGRTTAALGRGLSDQRTQQIVGAIAGAHLDSMEEISRGYDEQFQYALGLGLSDEDARNYASTYASKAYNEAWLYGVAFNAIELNSLLKGSKVTGLATPNVDRQTRRNIQELATKGRKFTGLDYAAAQAAEGIENLSKWGAVKASLNPAKEHLTVLLSEGFEEMRVDYALQEGELAAKRRFGIYDPLTEATHIEKLSDFLQSNEAWDSFIWGAFGGLTVSAGRGVIQKLANPKSFEQFKERQYKTINDALQRTMEILVDYDGDLSIVPDVKTRIDENGVETKTITDIKDPARSLYVPLFNIIGQANALEYGELYLNELAKLTDVEFAEAYGDANKRELIRELQNEFKIAKNIYNKNRQTSWGSIFDPFIQNQMATYDYLENYYRRQLLNYDTELRRKQVEYNTDLNKLDLQINELKSRLQPVDEALANVIREKQALSSAMRDIQVENHTLTNERYEILLQQDNYKAIIEDADTAINDLKVRHTNIQRAIKRTENAISRITNPSVKASEISRLERERAENTEIVNALNRARTDLYKAERELDIANSKLTVIDGQIAHTQTRYRAFEIDRNEIQKSEDNLSAQRAKLTETLTPLDQEYQRLNNLKKNVKLDNGFDMQLLEEMYDYLTDNLAQVNSINNHRQEVADTLNETFAQVQNQINESERLQAEPEPTPEVVPDTPENVEAPIEVSRDNNGVQYTTKGGEIINASTDSRQYNVGDTVRYKGADSKITWISLNNDGNIVLKVGNDNVFPSLFDNANRPDLVQQMYSVAEKYNQKAFANNFICTLTALQKYMQSRDYKRIFKDLSYDSNIVQQRAERLRGIINVITEAAENNTELTVDEQKLLTDVLGQLNTDHTNANSQFSYNKLYEYVNSLLNIDATSIGAEAYETLMRDYVPKLVRDLTNYISTFAEFGLSNNSLIVNRIYGLDEFQIKVNDIISSFIKNLNTSLAVKFELESFDIVNQNFEEYLFKINDNIREGFSTTVNDTVKYQNLRLKKLIGLLENSKGTIKKIDAFSSFNVDAFIKFAESIYEFNERYAKELTVPTAEQFAEIQGFYNENINIFTTFLEDLDLNEADRGTLNTSGLKATIDQINDIYRFFDSYVTAYDNAQIRQEDAALHSINVLARLGDNEFEAVDDNDFDGNYIFDRSDYRYYVSPSDLSAYKALNDIVARHRLRNKFTPNHKMTYQDVLDLIYNSENGTELLERLYEPIWNGLKHAADYDRINALKARIKANVPESNYDAFFKLLDNIQASVQPPLRSINKKFIDGNDNIRRSYLTEFKKTHKRYAWKNEIHEGVILPNNAIFDALNSIYDAQTKTVEHSITIDGIEFTAKELIQAQQNLKTGQELAYTLDESTGDVLLKTEINGKALTIGKLSLNTDFKFGNLPLSKQLSENSGLRIYDSFLGTSTGLGMSANRLISEVSRSQRIFDKIREYYKEYYNQRLRGEVNTEASNAKLKTILDELGQINLPENLVNNTAYNAIVSMATYNTNSDEINYTNVYNVIEPIFYNVDIESIDDFVRSGARIKASYNNLNAQLAMNFNATEAIKSTLASDPAAKIKISYINKTAISYANNKRTRSNINENIEKTTTINGKPAVNIVSVQAEDNVPIVSSLTENSKIDREFTTDFLLDPDRHFQLSAEIKLNDDSNGVSYIPLKRSALSQSTNPDSRYASLAQAFVIEGIQTIALDRFATNLSTQASGNPKVKTFVASEAQKQTVNNQFNLLLGDLSEAIIIDNNHDNNTIPWFNVSNLYENLYGDNAEMSKNIEFISVARGGRTSYGYNIRIVYEYNNDVSAPSKIKRIEVSRTRTLSNRTRGEQTIGLSEYELSRQFGEESGKYAINDKYKKSVIFVNSNEEAANILNSKLFTNIFGGMQRSVNTAYNNNSYTYTSRATGQSFGANLNQIGTNDITESTGKTNANGETITHKVFNDRYESAVLNWGKLKGMYSGNTSFDSIQDFYLNTDAVTTGSIGIKDSQSGEVITNYQLNGVSPKIYVTIDSDVVEPKTTENVILDSIDKARTTLEGVQSPNITNGNNWFTSLGINPTNAGSIFSSLGIANEYTSNEAVQALFSLYSDTYGSMDTMPLVIINNANEYQNNTGTELTIPFEDFKAVYLPSKNAILISRSLFNKSTIDLQTIGQTITHETLHVRVKQLLNQGQLNNQAVVELNGIVDQLRTITNPDVETTLDVSGLNEVDIENLNSFLSVIESAGENAYSELISYAFTDSTLADILNRITLENPITNTQETLWNRIINAILEVLGIANVNENSSLAAIRNTIINNIRNGKPTSQPTQASTLFPTGGLTQAPNDSTNRGDVVNPTDVNLDITNIEDDFDALFATEVFAQSPSREQGRSLRTSNSSDIFANLNNNAYIEMFKNNYTDENNLKIC